MRHTLLYSLLLSFCLLSVSPFSTLEAAEETGLSPIQGKARPFRPIKEEGSALDIFTEIILPDPPHDKMVLNMGKAMQPKDSADGLYKIVPGNFNDIIWVLVKLLYINIPPITNNTSEVQAKFFEAIKAFATHERGGKDFLRALIFYIEEGEEMTPENQAAAITQAKTVIAYALLGQMHKTNQMLKPLKEDNLFCRFTLDDLSLTGFVNELNKRLARIPGNEKWKPTYNEDYVRILLSNNIIRTQLGLHSRKFGDAPHLGMNMNDLPMELLEMILDYSTGIPKRSKSPEALNKIAQSPLVLTNKQWYISRTSWLYKDRIDYKLTSEDLKSPHPCLTPAPYVKGIQWKEGYVNLRSYRDPRYRKAVPLKKEIMDKIYNLNPQVEELRIAMKFSTAALRNYPYPSFLEGLSKLENLKRLKLILIGKNIWHDPPQEKISSLVMNNFLKALARLIKNKGLSLNLAMKDLPLEDFSLKPFERLPLKTFKVGGNISSLSSIFGLQQLERLEIINVPFDTVKAEVRKLPGGEVTKLIERFSQLPSVERKEESQILGNLQKLKIIKEESRFLLPFEQEVELFRKLLVPSIKELTLETHSSISAVSLTTDNTKDLLNLEVLNLLHFRSDFLPSSIMFLPRLTRLALSKSILSNKKSRRVIQTLQAKIKQQKKQLYLYSEWHTEKGHLSFLGGFPTGRPQALSRTRMEERITILEPCLLECITFLEQSGIKAKIMLFFPGPLYQYIFAKHINYTLEEEKKYRRFSNSWNDPSEPYWYGDFSTQ